MSWASEKARRARVDGLFSLIAPIVLEAAAAKCEVVLANGEERDWRESALTCAQVIRAMKGTL